VCGGEQGETNDVEHGAADHQPPIAVFHHHGACDGLQKSPREVLDRDRQREVRHRDRKLARQLRREQAEALADAEAQGQHQRGAEQDRGDGAQRPQIRHGLGVLRVACWRLRRA
jgi:hypothetical protein